MNEKLARAVLALGRELRECAASGESPAAAVGAARNLYSAYESLLAGGCGWLQAEYELAASVYGGCEHAVRIHAVDQARASEVLLPRELHRLRHLLARAEEAERHAAAECC